MKEVQHIQTIQLKNLLKFLLKQEHVEGVTVCVSIILHCKSLTQGICAYEFKKMLWHNQRFLHAHLADVSETLRE